MMNDVDRSVPGIERRLAITERTLKPGSAKKREKHLMVKGGEQGRIATSNRYSSSRKSYRDAHPRTPEQRQAMIDRRSGPMYRGEEDIKDFEKYVGWRGRPTQTIGQKRSAILAGRRAAEEAARTAEGRRRLAETGFEETVMMMGEYAPMSFEEREEFERRAEMARRGRMGAAAAGKRRAETAAAAAAPRVPYRLAAGEEYMDNPRRSQKAGLAKGQNLMQQAAAAYRAGKYDSMQEALRGVARGGRRKNPTLLEESMVSNPRRGAKGAVSLEERGGRFHVNVESDSGQSNLLRVLKKHGEWVPGDAGNDAITRYSMSRSEAEAYAKEVSDALSFPILRWSGRTMTVISTSKAGRTRPFAAEEYMDNPRRRRKFEEEDGSVFLLARSSAHFSDRAHERLKRYHVAAMVESRKNVRPLQNALKAYGEWVIEGNEAVSRYSMSLSEAENLAKSVAAGLGLSLHEVGGKITRFQTSEKPGRAKPYAAEEYMDNPRRKSGKSKSAKSAQGNAARAMSLFRSGEADSLSEAWAMVKRRA
jgi:hypothetical protein